MPFDRRLGTNNNLTQKYMTQQEFEERTGREVTCDEFDRANAIYMAAGDMDKDRFCADYKRHKDSEIIEVLFETADGLSDKLHVLRKERECLVDFLIDQAERYCAGELRDKAIDMIGAKEYLRKKIERGYNLWEADRELLIRLLDDVILPPPLKNYQQPKCNGMPMQQD